MADCPVTGFDCITCDRGKCVLSAKMTGIKASRGEGNGYNMPGGKKKLAARVKDAKRKGKSNA